MNTTMNTIEQKVDSARAKCRQWERKLTLATTKLTKYRKQLARLERTQADALKKRIDAATGQSERAFDFTQT